MLKANMAEETLAHGTTNGLLTISWLGFGILYCPADANNPAQIPWFSVGFRPPGVPPATNLNCVNKLPADFPRSMRSGSPDPGSTFFLFLLGFLVSVVEIVSSRATPPPSKRRKCFWIFPQSAQLGLVRCRLPSQSVHSSRAVGYTLTPLALVIFLSCSAHDFSVSHFRI